MTDILSNPSYFIPPLVGVAITLILLTVALLWSRRDFATLLFCGILLGLALVNIVIFGMRSSPDIHHALLWEKALAVTCLPAYGLYYHFTLVYTNNKGQRGILFTCYLLIIVVAALAPTNLEIEGMRIDESGYAPIMGPLGTFFFSFFPLLTLLGAYNLLKHYRAYPDNPERVRLIYLAAAAVFPLLGAIWDAFTTLPPMFIWSNLIFCILCSVAILKYRLLDIQVFIRKSSVFVVVSVVAAAPYVFILLLVNRYLGSTAKAWWAHAAILLVLAIALRPLYGWAQHLVDRLFFRRRYDYLLALEDFSRETHHINDLNQLSYSLVKLVGRAFGSSDVQLFLVVDSSNFFRVASAEENKPQFNVPNSDFILQWLQDNSGLLYRRDLATVLQPQPSTTTRINESSEAQAEVIVPIVTREHNLIGILALGEKISEQSYSQEDELLLITVSNHIAVQLENARLYDSEKNLRIELEKQNDQKTEFLNQVAHEMKTPLTSLLSSSELLEEKLSSSDDITGRLVRNLRRSADSMNRRVSELLDLARTENIEMQLDVIPLSINNIIKEIYSDLDILLESKNQKLSLDIAESLPEVSIDKGRFEQIIYNLLSNANKFSPDDCEITLRAWRDDKSVYVEVQDEAPPISDIEKTKIFDPYYRGEDITGRSDIPGLGLGLYITKKLVELHKGEIWVDNSSPKGNIFTFSLPILE